jgi:hypothetical protein
MSSPYVCTYTEKAFETKFFSLVGVETWKMKSKNQGSMFYFFQKNIIAHTFCIE